MLDSDIEDIDWEDDFEWLDSEIAEELEASASVSMDDSIDKKQDNKSSDGIGKKNLFRFVSALQQMEYNFYGKLARTCDYAFIKERIDSNTETADMLAEHLGYKKNKLSDMYYYNILLRQVAYIETSAREGGASFNTLVKSSGGELLSELSALNSENIIYLEDDLSSNDISLHIKSAILPYALYYEGFIQKVTAQNRTDLEKYILMIISMAKDVSTRWSKDISATDKALVFVTVLPIVARFTMQHTENYLNENVSASLERFDFGNKDVYLAIEEYDGGYSDFPDLKSHLHEKIDSMVNGEIDTFILLSWDGRRMFPREKVKLIIMEKLYDVWVKFCEQELIEFKKMDQNEKESYIKANNNVINTEVFFDMVSVTSKKIFNDIFKIDINWTQLEKEVREKFSMYWGVSDAVFKNL